MALFSDLPPSRKREISSAVGHYIAGVLDRDSMVSLVERFSEVVTFQPGDRVKTLKGSITGKILRVLADGRVVVKTDPGTELTALPESLLKLGKR